MTQDEFIAAARRDGYSEIVARDMAPGAHNAEHAHDFDARVLVLAGELTLRVGDAATRHGVGEHCSVPAGTRHAETAGPAGARYLAARRLPA